MKNTNGFVAGTLVHTDNGLVPIQAIKVGDKVLSKPESGNGKAEYKKVLSTFKSAEKQKLYKVEYFNNSAHDRGEIGRNYIFCTDNHPFWVTKSPTADINASLKGEWFAADTMPPGYLSSAHGDELELNDYNCLPVRTLPNFPKGCAYVQSIEDHDGWNCEFASDVGFVEFSDSDYKFIDLCTPENNEEKITQHNYYFFSECININNSINANNNFEIDTDKFSKLNLRLVQDIDSDLFTSEIFKEHMLSPVIMNDKVVMENHVRGGEKGMKDLYRILDYIDTYGDNNGLIKDHSIHQSMKRYTDECPNPYKNYVYNLEVEDTHTYFVGHDGVWVHT